MQYAQLYAGDASQMTQPVSQPAAATRDTQPQSPAASAAKTPAITISWLGIIIALVLLRLVFEFSE